MPSESTMQARTVPLHPRAVLGTLRLPAQLGGHEWGHLERPCLKGQMI